jgi:hypothetical protein
MVMLFGQLNIAKMSTHSELALSRFMYTENMALMALQETGHWDVSSSLFRNHSIFLNTNLPTPNLSGVGLVIDKKLKPESVTELNKADTVDIVWCQIILENKRVLVGSAYCKPTSNSDNLKDLLSNITCALKFSKTHNFSSVIVYGDFNARNADWGDTVTSNRGKCLAEYIEKEGLLLSSPYENTFVCDGGGSVIDLVLTHGKISDAIGEQWMEKDVELFSGAPRRGHYPILHGVNNRMPTSEVRTIPNWEKANWEQWSFYVEAESVNLMTLQDTEDHKYIWESFINILTSANSFFVPKKKICQH